MSNVICNHCRSAFPFPSTSCEAYVMYTVSDTTLSKPSKRSISCYCPSSEQLKGGLDKFLSICKDKIASHPHQAAHWHSRYNRLVIFCNNKFRSSQSCYEKKRELEKKKAQAEWVRRNKHKMTVEEVNDVPSDVWAMVRGVRGGDADTQSYHSGQSYSDQSWMSEFVEG